MATNGGNIVVPVGVQLELNNVQDIISSLQKAMSNVKPDTKGYAGIVSELTKAEKKADALAAKLNQGFTTKVGLQNFTKGFEDLIAMVDVVNNKVGQINFDNLTLTADQQAKMNEFAKNIQDAQNAYNSFETGKLKDAVNASQELQNVFKNLNLNINTTSLDSAINSIKTKIASIQKEIDAEIKKATANETRATSRQSEIDELNRLKKLFTSKDLSKTFPEFFKDTGDFKRGGNQALVNLLQQLGIDNDTIELVKKTAGKKIKEIQAEMEKAISTRIKTKEKQRDTASDSAKAARDAIDQLNAQKNEFATSQQNLQNVQNDPGMIQARQQETDAIAKENEKIREFMELVMKAFNGNLGKNSNDLKAALDAIRASGGAAAAELENLSQRTRTIENIKRSIGMWMGFNQVLRLTRTTIRNVVKDIRDLDKVMTEIAVVTNMSQKDLWNQMNTYQGIAKQYGVATTGVYQVSQIYYQQGLQTSDVMNLTNETLKMAKIAGLDYGKAADYMTVAIRGFKMEMTDAQNVVDVYSNLAAKSASDTTELATAMSKTASSAAAVGSSFENTSAMIAMMVETTRESAENIGSALKSIISRYGEMKSDPSKLIDSEGEALSLNKVDAALQSVGISLHDAQGQFRDFDDVILELSSKWDTLDKNSQRYIATIMAGNRQQSRFLALVSDYDRLSELTEVAANSEDAALVQTLKTMDSLETKIQNVKNAFQGFYGNLGLENVFKGALDVITNIINRLNAMPKAFGKIPIAAIGMVANVINVIKTLGSALITVTTAKWQQIAEIIKENIARGFKEGADEGSAAAEGKAQNIGNGVQYNKKKVGIAAAGRAVSMIGTGISTAALTIGDKNAKDRGGMELLGGALSGIGQGVATGALMGGGLPGIILGGISGIMSALPSVIAGINDLTHAEELAIKAAKEEAKQAQENATIKNAEAKNLDTAVKKLENLSEARFDSNEAYQEWIDYQNQLVDQYPELLAMYDAEGNAVINTSEAYQLLADKRREAAVAALEESKRNNELQVLEAEEMNNILNQENKLKLSGDKSGQGLKNADKITYFGTGASVETSLGDFDYDIIDKLFVSRNEETVSEYLNKFMENAKVSSLELTNLDLGVDLNARDWIAEQDHDLQQLYGNLIYNNYIEPLAKSSIMQGTEYDLTHVQAEVERISKDNEGNTERIEQLTYEYYMKIIDDMIAKAGSIEKLNEEIRGQEQKIAEINASFSKVISDKISSSAVDSEIKTLSKIQGDSLSNFLNQQEMQSYKLALEEISERHPIPITSEKQESLIKQHQEEYINKLTQLYTDVGELTWADIESLLSHPEQYSSKEILLNKVQELFGDNWDSVSDGIIANVDEIWKATNKDLQQRFVSNIFSSKKSNDQIKQYASQFEFIGNGGGYTEIAAQYLNDINKQWTDLVTNQKNEAVATQNAKFLADTYVDVGQLSEEANGAMANILSTAELNTREGIQNVINQIEQYQTKNEVSSEDAAKLESILANLRQHKADLLLNLNTEIQSYVDSLSDAIENIGKNYSNNISGFSKLSDANEVLQKINNEKIKIGEEQLNFNDVFTFDKTLGKYVFTIKGLIEANNQVIKNLDSKYEDTIDQLNQEKDIFSEITSESGLGSDIQKNKGDKTKVINALKEASDIGNYTDEQQSYLEDLAIRYEQSDKEWDVFIESERKRLDQLGINIDQAHEAMLKMTVEAQQREAFKAIDFSAIVNGSKSFEEAEQSFLNYYATQINQDLPEWLQNIQMNLAKVTSKVAFNAIKMGGQSGLNMYRLLAAVTGQETDKNTENEIYNARVKAISSLHSKIQKATGQERIQLDDAERIVLGITSRDIGATELAEKYSQLIDEVRQGVKNGQTDIETANAAIIDEEFSDELSLNKQTSALASIGTSKITPESIKTLANTMGVLSDLSDDFDIKQLKGLNEEGFITNIDEFLNSFNDLLVNKLTDSELEKIASSLELADKSKITDAAVQAENSIIESIATEINNIKSAGIGKKVNLTYLTNKLGATRLEETFGEAYKNGTLTITEAVKSNMYNSLKNLRSELSAKGYNTDEIDKALQEYVDSAISEMSDFTGSMTLSDNTAQLLASRASVYKNELATSGKIALNTIEEFVHAANLIYGEVSSQYNSGLADLTKLNSAYSNIIKGNLAKQAAGFNMLTSASKIDLTSLQNFLNVYNKKLSDYVNKMGNLTTAGAAAGLKSLGNGNYQIADWHKFISQLQITANELSTEYIDAYVSWLESDANVAPNAKEALMTSLIPNMEKLTYAQIGQIAKTFNMTVDQVLALVENNGDNTFNANNLINSLNFDRTNREFSQAFINQKKTVTSNMTSAMISYIEAGSDGDWRHAFGPLQQAMHDFEDGLQALGISASLDVIALARILRGGGEQAVAAAEQIAALSGQELSASDIETLYRGQVGKLVNAIDTVVAQPGEIIDTTTANLINLSGGKATELGTTGQYVVETAANLYEAYHNLLQKLIETGETTLADVNKVTGMALDNKDGQQVAIDALGDAANLTYSRLGEIFTSANKLMTEELVQSWADQGLIKSLGGNKIQITDFAKFAELMEFDIGSPEYISAFKTYNESLIDMNRKAERNILEEAQSLGDMKAGDWIDLTQLSDKLNNIFINSITESDGTALNSLNSKLINYGAYLENGILKTVNGANIPAIIQEIANSVQQYGNLSEAELAQLTDTLKEVLKSYADLISGAIEGSLSDEGAQQLSQWSESLGLGKLNFQETTQGLKLATDQAYRLYQEISKIDALQGRVVFDNLAEFLRADKGGDFSSATATMATTVRVQQQIVNTNAEIQSIYAKVEGNVSRLTDSDKNRLAVLERQSMALKDQLQLAQEMAWSNMDNPDSYDFMGRDLPSVFQGPINYWNSVGDAFGAMRDAGKTGKMEIQDFYNIVTEMSNLAAATGTSIEFMGQSINGDLTQAANLIDAGFNSLSNVDGKGVKVDMGKLAANLQTGATDMGKGFDTAINQMAEAQVHMLDGMIKLMETIVAMEQLGQVDVDSNGILSIDEIFGEGLVDGTDWHQYSEEFNQVREYLLNTFEQSKELAPLLDNLKVSGVTLRELFDQDQTEWRKAGISEQQYANIMTAFYQAATSDAYDLDNLISSVMNVLSGSGQVFSYYNDETGVETVINAVSGRTYTVNWNDKEDKQRVYDAFKAAGYDKVPTDDEIRAILDKGHAGELTGEALIAYELTYGLIKEYTVKDDDGNEKNIWKDSYGNTYDSKEAAVIGNAFAKQQGEAEGDRQEITGGPRNNLRGYKQTFKMESGLTYDLTVGVDGSEKYETTASDNTPISGSTYQEMVDNLLQHESQLQYDGKNYSDLSEPEQIDLQRKLGVTVTPEVIFKNSEGNEVDPANDPKIRSALTNFFNHSHDELKDKIQEFETKDGKKGYEITLFDGSKIQVEAENEGEALQKVQEALDPIITSISTAITTAFTSVNESGGNAVQEAITTAIQKALGIGEQQGEEGSGLTMSGITLAPQGLTIKTEGIEPTISGAEESSEVPIPEVTLTPESLVLQLKGLEPTPEGGKKKQEIEGGEVESKPTKISLNLEGTTPTTEGTANTQEVPYGAITLKPASITVDTSGFDATSVAQEIATAIQNALSGITLTPPKVGSAPSGGQESDKGSESSGDTTSTSTITVTIDDTEANSKLDALLEKANSEDNQITVNALTDNAEDAVSTLQGHANEPANKTVNASTSMAEHKVSTLHSNAEKSATKTVNADTETAMRKVGVLDTNANAPASKTVSIAAEQAQSWKDFLKDLDKKYSITVEVKAKKTGDWPEGTGPKAGNVALAKGTTGEALAGGRTLMGELGPELVVSKGRYFVVGGSGPEMVNLAPDAIVFNHIQTRQLLENGRTSTHAKPITNERKAVSMATGNVSGVAMASASAALAALKQLRAMWASLMNASLADMGGMPRGSGGGGGGGGGGSEETKEAVEGINAEVERWYNWLKLIEATQNEINKLTKKYDLLTTKGAETSDLSANLKEQAKQLQIQLSTAHQLRIEQENYRKDLIKTANQGLFSAFYRADPKTGQVYLANDEAFMDYVKKQGLDNKYMTDGTIEQGEKIKVKYNSQEKTRIGSVARKAKKDNIGKEGYKSLSDEEKQFYTKSGKLKSAAKIGSKLIKDQPTSVKIYREGGIKTGLDFMDELFGQKDKAGNNRHTAEEQLALIKAMGFYTDDLLAGVDTSQDGWEAQVVQNFKDKIDSDKAEIEALNQSIQEQAEAELEYEKRLQEINNELFEIEKHHQGVIDHLESWYEWSRKIAANQHELNMLTAQYSRLQNGLGDSRKQQYENLRAQITTTSQQLKNTKQETKEMKADFNEMAETAGATIDENGKVTGDSLYGGIYKVDENGNLVYNDKLDLTGRKVKDGAKKGKFKVTTREKLTDITAGQGEYVRDGSNLELTKKEKEYLKFKNTTGKFKKNNKKNRKKAANDMGIDYETFKKYYTYNSKSGKYELTEEGKNRRKAARVKQTKNERIQTDEGITKAYRDEQAQEVERLDKEIEDQKQIMEDNKKYSKLANATKKKFKKNTEANRKEAAKSLGIKSEKKFNEYYQYDKKTKKYVLKDTYKDKKEDYNEASETLNKKQIERDVAQTVVTQYDKGIDVYKEGKKQVTLDTTDPKKFFKQLTAKDKYGNSILDARQQAEVLVDAGFGDEMRIVDGVQYFDSLETATPEQLEEAAKAYLEYIQKVPEAWAEAKDKLDENVETEEELQTRISELNNQIRELYKPTEGITKHLESWYNWTRMTIDAQKTLNQLQAKYANLEKIQGQGSTTQKKIKNLQDQLEQTRISIEGNKGEQASRLKNLNKEQEKITSDSFFREIFKVNNDGSVTYRGQRKAVKDKSIQVTEIERDENGREVRYDISDPTKRLKPSSNKYKTEGKYIVGTVEKQYDLDDVFKDVTDKSGNVSVKDIVETITEEVSPGVSKYSFEAQTAMFQAIFGTRFSFENVAKFAGLPSWEEATPEQRNEALKSYLEYLPDAVENTNALKDAWEDSVTEGINLNGQAIDLNNQIYELLKPIEGVTDHLEEWYEWTRKTTAAQQQLNKLQNEYNNLQKQRALGQQVKNDKGKFENITDAKYIENLQQQGIQIQNSIVSNAEEQKERKRLWEKERQELVSTKNQNNPFLGIFTTDENGNVVYNQESKISGLTGTKKYKAIRTRNGQQLKRFGKEEYTYQEWLDHNKYDTASPERKQEIEDAWNQASWVTFGKKFNLDNFAKAVDIDKNGITQEEFFSGLTQKKNGKYRYTLQEQTTALEAAGYTDRIAKYYGQGPWDTLNEEQRNEAVEQFLSAVSTEAGRINQLRDDWEQSVIEGTALEGNLLDINQQIEEIATSSTAVANSFEKWYSWTQKIARAQSALNLLTAENSNLEKERVNNGAEIAENLRNQYKNNQQNLDNINGTDPNALDGYYEQRLKAYEESLKKDNRTTSSQHLFKTYTDENGFTYLDFNDSGYTINMARGAKTKSGKTVEDYFNKYIVQSVELDLDEYGNYQYDENGILKTKNRDFNDSAKYISKRLKTANTTEDILSILGEKDKNGQFILDRENQFAWIRALGLEDYMKFNDGAEVFKNGIDNATKEERDAGVEAFFKNAYAEKTNADNELGEIIDLKKSAEDSKSALIDIKNQIQDNEIELENKLMQAIEDREQFRIDELNKQKEMLEDAAEKFLDGLSKQLDKEKDMYERQEKQDELIKLQRQLAILQRSGGSSSQIRSLQEQIRSQQKDQYFDERQQQIDAIKEASDAEIERLDRQIQIAEETLTYAKENGLYWNEVRSMMDTWSSDKILAFINENLAERREQSSLQVEVSISEDGKIASLFTEFRDTPAFKQGGLIDYTGPAWVDGSSAKPESILTASQTDFLRNQLLNNLLDFSYSIDQFTKAALNTNTLSSVNENAGINIGQLDFVMKVDSIANDYDAKRAAQQAFEEMSRIARKSGNHSILRR